MFSFGVLVAGNAAALGEEGFARTAAPAIHVYANQSVILDSEFGIKRITVARPEIADVIVVSPRQMLIIGHSPGTTTLSYWNEADLPTTTNIVVGADLETVRGELQKIAPDETFEITSSGDSLILSGTASTGRVQSRLGPAAKGYSKNVGDLL